MYLRLYAMITPAEYTNSDMKNRKTNPKPNMAKSTKQNIIFMLEFIYSK